MAWSVTGTRVSNAAGDVPNAYVNQYAKTVLTEAQQAIRKLPSHMITMPISGYEAYVDVIHPFEYGLSGKLDTTANTPNFATATREAGPIQVGSRYEPTKFQHAEWFRVRVSASEYRMTVPFERNDAKRMLTDPRSPIVQEMIKSFNRKVDQICYNSFAADRSIGLENAGTWTWTDTPFSGATVGTIDGGFTVDLVQEIIKQFQYDEEDLQAERPVILLEENGWKQLFKDQTFISRDYNPNAPLPAYQLREYMGCLFVWMSSKRLSTVYQGQENVVTTYAWLPSAMRFAVEKEMEVIVSQRPDLNNCLQVWMELSIGAARIRDTGVIRVIYDQKYQKE